MQDKSRPGLYRRGKHWHVAIYPPKKSGAKPYRKALGTTDQALAQEWYDHNAPDIKKDFWRGANGLKSERYWEEAAAVYVEESERIDWGPDAARLRWVNSKLDGRHLSDITRELWKGITDQRRKETIEERGKCAGATLNNYTALVSAVLTKACRELEWTDKVPKLYIYEKAEPRDVVMPLALAQARFHRLPDWAKDPFLYSLATGARRRNVIGLLKPWLNLTERIASIPPRSFKQRRPHRQALNAVAVEIIRRQPGFLQDAAGSQPHVFLRDGEPITGGMIRHAWDDSKSAEDAHIQWKDMRRTWATWMRESGVDLEDTRLLGGWASKEMLVQVYSRPSSAFLVGKAGSLDEALNTIGTQKLVAVS